MAPKYDVNIQDIEYVNIEGDALLARLYIPQGEGPFPGLVEIHGGAWTTTDRLTNHPIHEPLAQSGIALMAIDFRMPPHAMYPASIIDINFAIRWLKKHSKAFSINPNLIGLLGTSSGGHQAMLSALCPDDSEFTIMKLSGRKVNAQVRFVVLCWSVLDPLARYHMVKRKAIYRLIDAHHAYWPSEEAMAKGNPQLIVENSTFSACPPVLLLQGTADDNLTPDMADRFANAYKSAGGSIILEKFDNQPHAFIGKDPDSEASLRAISLMKDFILRETGYV